MKVISTGGIDTADSRTAGKKIQVLEFFMPACLVTSRYAVAPVHELTRSCDRGPSLYESADQLSDQIMTAAKRVGIDANYSAGKQIDFAETEGEEPSTFLKLGCLSRQMVFGRVRTHPKSRSFDSRIEYCESPSTDKLLFVARG